MSGLTQDDRLRALGLKQESSQADPGRGNFERLKDSTTSFEEFRGDVQNALSTFDELENYLLDLVDDEEEALFDAEQAERFRMDLETKYDGFDALQGDLDEHTSYDEWESSFRFGTTIGGDTMDGDGEQNSGIRFHGEDGISYAGIPVPAGTAEIFAPRIELSQTEPTIEDPDAVFEVTNFEVSNTTPTPYETVEYSAQIENQSGYSTSFTARLMENDERVESKTLDFQVGETRTVTFTRRYEDYDSYEVRINDSVEETVVVIHPGLIA